MITQREVPRQPVAVTAHRPAAKKLAQPGNTFASRWFSNVAQCSAGFFQAGSYQYPVASSGQFTPASVAAAIAPLDGEAGKVGKAAGRAAHSGVEVGDVGSFAVVNWLGKVGDKLTGDHQPSGAAIKEAIREAMTAQKVGPLTRQMARNAYARAVTVVVDEAWHAAFSRTYGGRNTPAQIAKDAADLATAAQADWMELAPQLEADGWSKSDMLAVWDSLERMRKEFYAKGGMTLA